MPSLGPKVAVVYRSVAGPGACGLIVRSLDTPNHFVAMSPQLRDAGHRLLLSSQKESGFMHPIFPDV